MTAVPMPGAYAGTSAADTSVLDVALDVGARSLRGSVRYDIANPTRRPLTRVYLWLYPNRLGVRSPALDDVNFYWVYPGRFSPGSMVISAARQTSGGVAIAASRIRAAVHAIAGRNTLWSVELPRAIPPGGSVRIDIDFRGTVPTRYGAFGCVDAGCTLAGGFYPMLAALDASGWNLSSPPHRTNMRMHLRLARAASVVLFGQWLGNEVGEARASGLDVPYATAYVAPRFYETTRRVGQVEVRMLSRTAPPPAEDARGKILPYTLENYPRFALDQAAAAVRLLARTPVPPTPGTRLTIVEAPLRMQLASAQPGAILLSDRYYRIWPAKRFRKFHDRELVRALFGFYFARLAERDGIGRARDVWSRGDLIASYLTDLFVLKNGKRRDFADDILSPVSFVPAIDQLLYAPQTMFSSAYFGRVVDAEPMRDLLQRFNHRRPRGRLYYEKLRDLLRGPALVRAMNRMMRGTPTRRAAEYEYGSSLGWFFRQWTMPYPRVDYRIAGKRSIRLADGTYEHVVTVERRVEAGRRAPIEPVAVQVTLVGGERRALRWDGRGARGELRFVSTAPIARVVVDPRGRLVEQKLPGDSAHPRYNNVDQHRLRFVYNSFGVLLNVTDVSALLVADFSLSRVHDLHQRVDLQLFTSASTVIGARADYSRRFGSTITPDRLIGQWAVGVGGNRLRGGFFGEGGASRVAVSGSLGTNNKLFVFEPLTAAAVGIGGAISLLRRDATATDPANVRLTGSLSASASRTFTPRDGQTLAGQLRASLAFGQIESRSQLVTAGGARGLRGFAPGEIFGRSRIIARGEWRHNFVHGLNWNVGHYTMLHAVGGAAFADAGAVSGCGDYDLARPGSFYASAGYGIRFHYDSFGTMPQMMRVDLAFRIAGSNRACLGQQPAGFPPVMVYVGFLPPF